MWMRHDVPAASLPDTALGQGALSDKNLTKCTAVVRGDDAYP